MVFFPVALVPQTQDLSLQLRSGTDRLSCQALSNLNFGNHPSPLWKGLAQVELTRNFKG